MDLKNKIKQLPSKPNEKRKEQDNFSSEEEEKSDKNSDDPKPGRKMGFPNFSYLDPDVQGPPVKMDQTHF